MNIFGKDSEHKLAGISGTFASGKDTAARHLVDKGLMHVSLGDVCRTEASRQGRDHGRVTLAEIAVEMRERYGSVGGMVIKAVEQWEERRDEFLGGLVISGVRVPGEAEEIPRQKGTLIFTDAPVEIRYEGALERARKEGRTIELANVFCLEDFIESERYELEGLGGPNRIHLRGVEVISDVVIQNTGTEEELLIRVDNALGLAA